MLIPAEEARAKGSAEMHYFQSMIAKDIAHGRIREAAQQRLADEARRGRGQPGFAARLEIRLAALIGQLRFRSSIAADTPDCA
jgi:acetyl/propionyl-CoA carboxylase alpha subunit